MLQSFSDYFSFGDMLAVREAAAGRRLVTVDGPEKDAAYTNYFAVVEEKIAEPLLKFIKEMHALGVLRPSTNGAGYDCRFVKAWDAIATNNARFNEDPDACWDSIERKLRKLSLNMAGEIAPFSDTPAWTEEKLYTRFIDTMNSGDIEWFMTGIDDSCGKTDRQLSVQLNNWTPEIWYFEPKKNNHLVAEPRAAENTILHTVVNFPSGHLLVADWFRIDAFTDLVENNNIPSINSEAGIEARVRDCAERLGFIHVFVGNSCPGVFVKDSQLVIGHDYGEVTLPVGYEEKAHVTTDLWWATLIDKETMITQLAPTHGDAARSVVEEYIRNEDIDEIHIAPGTYHLYFDNDQRTFVEKFAAEGVDLTGIERPYCMISQSELTLVPKETTFVDLAPT